MELNPLLSIWTQPKETVRQLINHNKLGLSIILACIAGIGAVLAALQDSGWFQDMSTAGLAVGIIIMAMVSGLINVGVSTLLYTVIGKLYGGHGKMREMAIAVGPMMIPQIFILPVYMIYVWIYGRQFFAAPADFNLTSIPLGAYLILLLFTLTASIWTIVISSKAIGVVHGFSSWRGFGVVMTLVGIFILLGMLIAIGFILFLI